MQVEAIYDQGKLEFLTDLQLKHDRLRLIVTVPDEEIVSNQNPYNLPPEVVEGARKMLARMEEIRSASLPPDEALPELTEKQLERIEAYDLRDEIKGMR